MANTLFPNLHVVDHPLLHHKLSLLRDERTPCQTFRTVMREAALLLAFEATRHLPVTEVEIQTPLCRMKARMLEGKKLVLVSVLRAGNGLLEGFLDLIPSARIGYLGLARDHHTLEAKEYYCNLPGDTNEREVILLDPMLATGHSSAAAIERVLQYAPRTLTLVSLVAAPEGVRHLQEKFPTLKVFTGALDERLNERGYIVPGLGDAGDRLFGTK